MRVIVLAALATLVRAGSAMAADDLPQCPADGVAAAFEKLPAAIIVPDGQNPADVLDHALGCKPPQDFQPWKGISVTAPNGTSVGKIGDLLTSKEGEPQYLALQNAAGEDFGAVSIGKIGSLSTFSADTGSVKLPSTAAVDAFNGDTVFFGPSGGSAAVVVYNSQATSPGDLLKKGLNPFGPMVLIRFRSTPVGASVDVAGNPNGNTNESVFVQQAKVTSVDIRADGYALCTYTQGQFQPPPAGGDDTALFSCTLKRAN